MILLNKENISDTFNIRDKKGITYLTIGNAKEIAIKLPLPLNEDLAKISAMLLDGCLSKDLSNIMFSQKKDKSKAKEFSEIIQNTFDIKTKASKDKKGTSLVNINSKTLAYFLYFCLDISKSDKNTKIHGWIYTSPKNVMRQYLRYAFAMEGSIRDSRLYNPSIRFHSCDKKHVKELQKFIKDNFGVNFKFFKYFIKNYGWKYYLEINAIKEVRKFKEIGFALKSHQRRLNQTINLAKPKAWKITLKKLLDFKNNFFKIDQTYKIFPYLGKRAVHHRLTDLVNMNYLCLKNQGYMLTDKSLKKAKELKDIKEVRLRTKPRENEVLILELIRKNHNIWRNEMARILNINPITIKDVLKRLIIQNKIELSHIDRFQRRFYRLKCGLE